MLKVARTALALAAICAGPGYAQTTMPSQTTTPSTAMPAVATPTTPPPAGAPVAGANSFTESQARKRIEDMGYTNVMGLMKDNQSIWRGTAMKGGASMAVALSKSDAPATPLAGKVRATPTAGDGLTVTKSESAVRAPAATESMAFSVTVRSTPPMLRA